MIKHNLFLIKSDLFCALKNDNQGRIICIGSALICLTKNAKVLLAELEYGQILIGDENYGTHRTNFRICGSCFSNGNLLAEG